MKPVAAILLVLIGVLALGATVWIGKYNAVLPPPGAFATSDSKLKQVGPPVAEEGPFPKAVAPETEHNFGVMNIGESGQHAFIIKNEGEAPLTVIARKEDTTCQCTFADLGDTGSIPPGGQTEVKLNWGIRRKVAEFRHRATVRTNDPDNKSIDLFVTGKVEDKIEIVPMSLWQLGDIDPKEPTTASGIVFSRVLDSFDLTSLKAKNPLVSITATPLNEEQREEIKAKSGYKVVVTVAPGVPVGIFRDEVTIEHNVTGVIPSEKEDPLNAESRTLDPFVFKLEGRRPGPINMQSRGFNEATGLLALGEFPSAAGKTVNMSMFVRDFEDDLKILDDSATFGDLVITLEPDTAFKAKNARRYLLKFTVPPNKPGDHMGKQAHDVVLKLNHPEVPELALRVAYLSR